MAGFHNRNMLFLGVIMSGICGGGIAWQPVLRLWRGAGTVRRNGAVYFAAIGGAAALIAGSIKSAEVIAFDDLGAEAVRKLYVEDFPVTVVLDAAGGDLYEKGREEYLKSTGK